MILSTALRLGRVSNLPTVFTNVLVGIVLAGGAAYSVTTLLLVVALSLHYVAGMYFNDYFDRDFDSRHFPARPIPSGRATAASVRRLGTVFFVLGFGLVGLAAGGDGALPALGASSALIGLILFYDWRHRTLALGPLVMAGCRFMVYVSGAVVVSATLPRDVWIAGGVSVCWLIGLTYLAKQETRDRVTAYWPLTFLLVPLLFGGLSLAGNTQVLLPLVFLAIAAAFGVAWGLRRGPGDMKRSIGLLIAAISLVDAVLLADHGDKPGMYLAMAAFALTLLLHRVVPGT